jgi:3-oxoacyl-[acyl-carrier-protein] synthase-1
VNQKNIMNIIGDNIISALGFTTEENFNAVKQGVSGISHYNSGVFDLPEPFMASLIDKEKLNDEFESHCGLDPYTDLEKAAILSVFLANKEAQIDLSCAKTLFILSTTKGNIELLDGVGGENFRPLQIHLWHTAELIARFFGNPNTPIVVSNACISGAAAQIVAKRELESKNYDYAVVVGVDFLSKFIISGFQSFKALSPELCRPFDKDRCGLNLGEAAATLIYSRRHCGTESSSANPQSQVQHGVPAFAGMTLVAGAIRNDATHISAPSRTGEGGFRALKYILNIFEQTLPLTAHRSPLTDKIAFINAHGTATPYNDAMEVNAIVRAGLEDIPVNALKSYFGHTLGAAGIVETIISMWALNDGLILKTLGFEENEQLIINNEPFTLDVCRENRMTDKKYFVKMMSGFGGVNVALLFEIKSH